MRKPGVASQLSRREVVNAHLHVVVALSVAWLVATSPWVSMLRRMPADAGFFDYAHVTVGWLALVCGAWYAVSVAGGGRFRQYVPGKAAGIGGTIEGLLLLALITTAATGALWFVLQGSADALTWRNLHVYSARALIAVGVAHVLAVAAHLLDF
jgi:cytochrome b561